jgi:hypothetical protein
MYFLIDANIAAGYYLPRSLNSKKARESIRLILNYVRTHPGEHFIYVPNICIAETFSVFMKHNFGQWNSHVKKKGTIDTRVYKSITRQFKKDIHNGQFMYHYELSRYHILGINLVAPIDHYYKISRGKKRVNPMGTFDHLIISMGIHLAHIHGRDNVCILSCDDRLIDILSKCKSHIPWNIVKKLGLNSAHELTGRRFGPKLFPKHLNLKGATKTEYERIFHTWPLPECKVGHVYRHKCE